MKVIKPWNIKMKPSKENLKDHSECCNDAFILNEEEIRDEMRKPHNLTLLMSS